jgi:hypothetical protein
MRLLSLLWFALLIVVGQFAIADAQPEPPPIWNGFAWMKPTKSKGQPPAYKPHPDIPLDSYQPLIFR